MVQDVDFPTASGSFASPGHAVGLNTMAISPAFSGRALTVADSNALGKPDMAKKCKPKGGGKKY